MLRHFVAVDGKEGIPFASVGAQTYYFGRCGVHDVALLMCEMGSSKPGASTLAVHDAIERWKPRAALMVGIAFGRPDKGLGIGDVLVAEQIAPYELQRVGSATVHRAAKPPASVTLVNRFRNVLDWRFPDASKNPAVRVCEVLSGEKLVDNADFVARLFTDFPNALGGEMEGAGLFAAAEHKHVPWILAKAVCDFGHSKSKVYQPLAAAVAASLIAHVLKDPAMLDGLPAASGTEAVCRVSNADADERVAINLVGVAVDSEIIRQQIQRVVAVQLVYYDSRKRVLALFENWLEEMQAGRSIEDTPLMGRLIGILAQVSPALERGDKRTADTLWELIQKELDVRDRTEALRYLDAKPATVSVWGAIFFHVVCWSGALTGLCVVGYGWYRDWNSIKMLIGFWGSSLLVGIPAGVYDSAHEKSTIGRRRVAAVLELTRATARRDDCDSRAVHLLASRRRE